MGKHTKSAYFTLVLLLLLVLAVTVTGRPLGYSSAELISDGIDDVQENQSSIILLKRMDSSEENCEQMYGFLPCSNNLLGHLFLIVVYEYLLFHGESYVASGGERVFKILGTGVFGASAFQKKLHETNAFLFNYRFSASGLLNAKETAQEHVFTGVGLLAGSTILLLTLLWGTCVIVGSRDLPGSSKSDSLTGSNPIKDSFQKLLSFSTGYGINTDVESTYMARIMLSSVIPFIIIQIPKVFHLSSSVEHFRLSSHGETIVIVITLVVSVIFLLCYFFYQIFQPWIQKRRLEYVKHEHIVLDILKHVQKQTLRKVLTDDGAPNVAAIRRFRKSHLDKEKAIADVMEELDPNGDKKITMDEFINGFTKWIDETKNALDKRFLSEKSLQDAYPIMQPWIQKKKEEHETRKNLISEVLMHVQSYALGSLLTEDGTPHIPALKRLFEKVDRNKDNYISQTELKELISDIKFGKILLDADEAVGKIMEELDVNKDQMISEEEFISGFSNWLGKSDNQTPRSAVSQGDIYQKKWEETNGLVDERSVERSPLEWIKAIMLLVVGIVMLAVLAEPLIYSVQSFSKTANISPFFVSFILVPLATNARQATSAIKAASLKNPRATSLTFSEIYGGVFMNNILGFSVLLSLIYFRGLSWDYSAEVLIVLIVCAIMGTAASFRSIFPVWTSFMAFLLYPLSLLLVYVLDDFSWWSQIL
ncbi:hypothetical protein F0562_010599 [Nyssa sinensis]|uniref:EF-hand domain-containing protein n=1 Tax=Nyssa sinensis TaxID=561372 RepID=A0A5J5A0G7_9ASTE|nr:hypothetical protein F0562_010599 [Nyssa sinensis]